MAVEVLDLPSWSQAPSAQQQQHAIEALENGNVVLLPNLAFELTEQEQQFLHPDICDARRKNVSFNVNSGALGGVNAKLQTNADLKVMMERYASYSRNLLHNLFPSYVAHVDQGRTSYRPVEIAGRVAASVRKDDTRLHVDAFPATPTQGKRILRMFTNVNPHAQARIWHMGEDLGTVVQRFAPKVPKPLLLTRKLQNLCKITKSYRTMYDHFMLNIHNKMKEDEDYQHTVSKQLFKFQPGSTWCVFTDQVSHAVLAGQYLFEQTFYLPVHGMQNPATSPLYVLEEFTQQKLLDI